MLPPSHEAFAAYVRTMMDGEGLQVTGTARQVADTLLGGPSYFSLFRPGNHVLAAGLLPQRLRHDFGLSWNPIVRTTFAAGAHAVRSTVPWLPPMLRFVPSSR